MTLSKTQQKVVDRMRLGWELKKSFDLRQRVVRIWLQKDNWTKAVNRQTLESLARKGVVIEAGRDFPLVKYKLVEG